jgi:molecular chaperone DnaK
MPSGYTIGIDLGTTNTVVAAITGKKPEIVPNDVGERTTPSVVAFDDDGPFVGQAAKNQAVKNPEQTIQRIKREMGNPKFSKTLNGKEYSAKELSALILKHLVADAEAHLGTKVTDAVITVPAYFGNRQRQATKIAGEIAGLNVRRIINEPTAACLAYGLQKQDNEQQCVLVYDLGGGTFDVSIVNISSGVVEVKGTGGDDMLGGEDWDDCVIEWIIEQYEEQTGVDVTDDPEAMSRLHMNAQEAKHVLSVKEKTEIIIPYLSSEGNVEEILTREVFEDLTADLLNRTIERCKETLEETNLHADDIDKVLLVGGATRMPQVHDAVTQYFGAEPSQEVNPDEVVAMGGSVQASLLGGTAELVEKKFTGGDEGLLLVDVTPKTLGIELADGTMDPLIEKNSTFPVSVSNDSYTTAEDDQRQINIRVYEGKSELAEENEMLDEFFLKGIEPARAGEPEFQVTFSLDMSGILHVEATDMKRGATEGIRIEGVFESSQKEIMAMRESLPRLKDGVDGQVFR